MRKFTLSIAIALLAGSAAAFAQTVVPINGVTPALTSVTINNGPGDQNDPHISGDWVVYASDTSIRYYNFSLATDAQIPLPTGAWDLLSDISGSKIVFYRINPSGETAVMVFDAATPAVAPIEIEADTGLSRSGSAIGGNTVAYIDSGLLVIHDLATSTKTPIVSSYFPDQNPQVSPDGKHVTWEHCPGSNNCDILRVTFDEVISLWVWGEVSVTSNYEGNPDTNGTLAVYDSSRAGNTDIFWRAISSGPEIQLLTTGFERNPAIAGSFLSFERRSSLLVPADLVVYDMTTNLLYQITDTPLVTEQLTDITVLPDGRIRVVWASDEDGLGSRNIKSATFSLGGGDTTAPVLQDPIANVTVTLPTNSTATSTTVTFPTPTATDDSGTVTVTTSPASGAVFPIGTTTVDVTATDGAGNTDTGSFTVTVLHNFSGLLQPVDPMPTLNVVNAGAAVPVKFSLSGNKGLNIFAAGYPISSPIACDANEPGAVIEETVSAGGSSLSYDAAADVYSYVWKTNKAWKGTCRILALRLTDGSSHFAKFRFR